MQKTLAFIISILLLFNNSEVSFAQSVNREKWASSGTKINWYSFEDAYQLNKKKKKKIFVDVYTDWCGWCKKMDADTFTDPVIIDYMNKTFLCVKLNAERKDTVIIDNHIFVNRNPASKRSTHELAQQLLRGQMSYPSYVFLKEDSAPLSVLPGYQPAKDFEVYIHYFGEGAFENQIPFDEYKATFIGKIK